MLSGAAPDQEPYPRPTPERSDRARPGARTHSLVSGRALALILNLLATIHVVWFYVNRVPPHIHLVLYEQGRERTPFQYRILMMYPMRWAHNSPAVTRLALALNAVPGWFPNGIRPEGLIQALIDLACVAIAGIVARRLYQRAPRPALFGPALLMPYVYPLTLLMVAATYCLLNIHMLRFIYDLPSLAFFALGLEAIYYRRNPLWLAFIFIAATINRETSIFLLLFYAVAHATQHGRFEPRRLYDAAVLKLAVPMFFFWIAWHQYITAQYAQNPTQSKPRVYLNLALLILPITWPQMAATLGYLWPAVLLYRRHIHDQTLRAWLWITPLWFLFMLYYGILVEARLFGELIPIFAAAAALICEEKLLVQMSRQRRKTSRPASKRSSP